MEHQNNIFPIEIRKQLHKILLTCFYSFAPWCTFLPRNREYEHLKWKSLKLKKTLNNLARAGENRPAANNKWLTNIMNLGQDQRFVYFRCNINNSCLSFAQFFPFCRMFEKFSPTLGEFSSHVLYDPLDDSHSVWTRI